MWPRGCMRAPPRPLRGIQGEENREKGFRLPLPGRGGQQGLLRWYSLLPSSSLSTIFLMSSSTLRFARDRYSNLWDYGILSASYPENWGPYIISTRVFDKSMFWGYPRENYEKGTLAHAKAAGGRTCTIHEVYMLQKCYQAIASCFVAQVRVCWQDPSVRCTFLIWEPEGPQMRNIPSNADDKALEP